MPRQGVPYPSREICSLKCQIDALQRQINELMKSVNGVEGDGQGNVSLISGDPAIVINSDQVQHEIEISLDSSQLPAANVSSVNGQTGTVLLYANDIQSGVIQPTNNIEDDLTDLKTGLTAANTNIAQEVTDRQNGDAALQSNINALQGSIPGEAAQAVANDPTIAQLVAADAQNVKLTGPQTVGGVKTFNSSPIVPTPPAGSTDGSAANTNWISQTGDSSPNNLVHKSGNETIDGVKTFNRMITNQLVSYPLFTSTQATTAYIRCTTSGGAAKRLIFDVIESTGVGKATVLFAIGSNNVVTSESNVIVGTMESEIGIVITGGYIYITVKGACAIQNLYVRYGSNRRVTATVLDTPIDVSDTATYPDQYIVTW